MTTLTSTITSAKSSDLVFITQDNQLVTDSIKVAEYFGKRHHHVLDKLKSLECSSEFAKTNFCVCHKNNELQNGKPQPFYQMTKDGFMFLVMGFTGKRAAEIKERYINAFNEMQSRLSRPASPLDRSRMMLTWENGRLVAAKTLEDDHFIASRDKLATVVKEPGFLSLEQLIQLNHVVNERISCFALVADTQLKQLRAR